MSASKKTHFSNCVKRQQCNLVNVMPNSGRESNAKFAASFESNTFTSSTTLKMVCKRSRIDGVTPGVTSTANWWTVLTFFNEMATTNAPNAYESFVAKVTHANSVKEEEKKTNRKKLVSPDWVNWVHSHKFVSICGFICSFTLRILWINKIEKGKAFFFDFEPPTISCEIFMFVCEQFDDTHTRSWANFVFHSYFWLWVIHCMFYKCRYIHQSPFVGRSRPKKNHRIGIFMWVWQWWDSTTDHCCVVVWYRFIHTNFLHNISSSTSHIIQASTQRYTIELSLSHVMPPRNAQRRRKWKENIFSRYVAFE